MIKKKISRISKWLYPYIRYKKLYYTFSISASIIHWKFYLKAILNYVFMLSQQTKTYHTTPNHFPDKSINTPCSQLNDRGCKYPWKNTQRETDLSIKQQADLASQKTIAFRQLKDYKSTWAYTCTTTTRTTSIKQYRSCLEQ